MVSKAGLICDSLLGSDSVQHNEELNRFAMLIKHLRDDLCILIHTERGRRRYSSSLITHI